MRAYTISVPRPWRYHLQADLTRVNINDFPRRVPRLWAASAGPHSIRLELYCSDHPSTLGREYVLQIWVEEEGPNGPIRTLRGPVTKTQLYTAPPEPSRFRLFLQYDI